MGNVITFTKKVSDAQAKVIYMENMIKSHIVDLTEQRKTLLRIKRELQDIRRRLEIRLIDNEPGPDSA